MLYISIYSIVTSVFFMLIFISMFYLCLCTAGSSLLLRIGPSCLFLVFLLVTVRSVIWVDMDIFPALRLQGVVADLYAILHYELYQGVIVAQLLVLVWVAGAILCAVRRYRFEKRQFRAICRLPENAPLEKLVQQVCREKGISVKLRVVTTKKNSTPFVMGIKHPVMVFPENLCHRSEADLHKMIAHETAHCRNHDIALLLFMEVFCILYWWFPLMPLVKKKLKKYMEIRADATALEGMDEMEQVEYCEMLLRVAAEKVSPPPVLSSGLSAPCILGERIDCILNKPKESRLAQGGILAVVLAVGILSVPFLLVPEYPAKLEPGVFVLNKENSKIEKTGSSYRVYYNGELFFETENEEDLPYEVEK